MKKQEQDCLHRERDIKMIKNILANGLRDDESISFAIDGKWGIGKSFLLELLRQEVQNDYLFVCYNAWDNDYYEEPVIGILDSINDQINEMIDCMMHVDCKQILVDVATEIAKFLDGIVYRKFGFKPIETGQKIFYKTKKYINFGKIDDGFNPNKELKEAKNLLCKSLITISEKMPVVFVVDELDRCLPEYAIKVIERIHHINERVKNIATIICVDSEQLNPMIEHYYGRNDMAPQYLRKILDFSYKLSCGENSDDYECLLSDFSNAFGPPTRGFSEQEIYGFLTNMFEGFRIRNICKIINQTMLVDKLAYPNNEKRPLDFMCAELFIAWSIFVYGADFRNKFYNDFISNKPKEVKFINYLSKHKNGANVLFRDSFTNEATIDVHCFKVAMVYMMVNFKPIRPFVSSGILIPGYFHSLADSFAPYLLQLKF